MPKISHYVNKLVETYRALPDLRVRSSYWGNPRVGAFVFSGEGRNLCVMPLYRDYLERIGAMKEPNFHYLGLLERNAIVAKYLGAETTTEPNLLDFQAAITGPGWHDRRTPRVHRIRRMILRRLAK